jgi:hypothetical protein
MIDNYVRGTTFLRVADDKKYIIVTMTDDRHGDFEQPPLRFVLLTPTPSAYASALDAIAEDLYYEYSTSGKTIDFIEKFPKEQIDALRAAGPTAPKPAVPRAVPAVPRAIPAVPKAVPAVPKAVPAVPKAVPAVPKAVPAVPKAVAVPKAARTLQNEVDDLLDML